MSRNAKMVLAVLLAVAVGAGLIVGSMVAVRGGSGASEAEGPSLHVAADVVAELQGIPQSGLVLGAEGAPVTLVEFADLQCPFCAQWARGTLVELVDRYVRDGRLRIRFNGMAFLGPDSERALRAVYAAGLQNRAWEMSETLFAVQGTENSGWVSDALLRAAARAIPDLDPDELLEDMQRDDVTRLVEQTGRQAEARGIAATPTFLIGRTGGELERLEISSLDPDEFVAAIEERLDS